MGALMKAALAWERFVLKDVTSFDALAKVELVPSADVGGMVRGVGNLTKAALPFKWAQASMKDVAVNTVVVTEIACWFFIGECIGKGSLGLPSLNMDACGVVKFLHVKMKIKVAEK